MGHRVNGLARGSSLTVSIGRLLPSALSTFVTPENNQEKVAMEEPALRGFEDHQQLTCRSSSRAEGD